MKKFLPIIFLVFSCLLSNKSLACDHCEFSLVSKTINGDGSVTYELDIKIEIGNDVQLEHCTNNTMCQLCLIMNYLNTVQFK